MKITTTTGLVGFLLALSTLNPSVAQANVDRPIDRSASRTIEDRLTQITEALQQRESQLQDPSQTIPFSNLEKDIELAGFSNWNNNRNRWRNSDRWRDWRNSRPWRNGNWRNGNWRDWRDGGWRDRGWRDGGGFLNFRL